MFELWVGDMRQSYLKAHHFLVILARIIVVHSVRRTAPASSGQSPYTPQHQVPGASDPPQDRRGPDLPPFQLSSTWHAQNLGTSPSMSGSMFLLEPLQESTLYCLCKAPLKSLGSRDRRKSQKMTGVFTKEKAEGDQDPVPTNSALLYRFSPAQARLSRRFQYLMYQKEDQWQYYVPPLFLIRHSK